MEKSEGEQDINILDNTYVQFSLGLSSKKESEDIYIISSSFFYSSTFHRTYICVQIKKKNRINI